MKNLKLILILFISISLTNCSSDDDTPPFLLSNANIAGTYEIGSLTGTETETATSSSGAIVNLSNATILGANFQINFALSASGTYTISGLYREVKRTTPNGGSASETEELLNIDSAGNYQINTSDNSITFSPTSGNFLSGKFDVNTFTTTILSISQETDENVGSNTISKSINIGFTKE